MSKHPSASSWTAVINLLLIGAITLLLAWSLSRRDSFGERHEAAPSVPTNAEEVRASEPSVQRPPNIVIFLIDTLRADRLGTYGHPRPASPQIDALAAESIVFDAAYAPAPWTLPSVVSLFTSMFPCEHGVLADGQRMVGDYDTLARRLSDNGYVTASFHANPYAGSASGMDAGFHHVELVPFVDGPLVDDWLNRVGDAPFFLYAHNIEPHDPYRAPQRLIRLFGDVDPSTCREIGERLLTYRRLTRVDFVNGQPLGTTDNTEAQVAAMERIAEYAPQIDVLYDAAVRDADEKVGRVIETLKRRNQWDNTLFILLADHGEELGDHGGWQHDQSVYEELVRVPLIVHPPANQRTIGRVGDVVSLVDIMPTVLEEVGLTGTCGACSGRSLIQYWTATERNADVERTIPSMRWNIKKYFRPYKETRGDLNVVVRVGDWKGIFNAEPRTLELYDLAEDPEELRNLADHHAGLVDAMKLAAREWLDACQQRAQGRSAPVTSDLDARQRERLRSLGYVE